MNNRSVFQEIDELTLQWEKKHHETINELFQESDLLEPLIYNQIHEGKKGGFESSPRVHWQ